MWRNDLAGRPNLRDKARGNRVQLVPVWGTSQQKRKGCEGREAYSPIAERGCVTLSSWDKATPKRRKKMIR